MGALSSLSVLGTLSAATIASEVLPQRAIPSSGEKLPIVGLGTTKPVRFIREAGTGPIESVIHKLISYGGCVIDTSPRPPELDARFGRVLQQPEFRDSLFVAAKVNTTGKEQGIAQIEQTQRLFGRDPLDLLQISSLTDLETQWLTLRAWKEAGKVRYIGVTVAHERLYATLEAFMKREAPDFVQLNYSVMEYTAEDRLLPLAADLGIAILVNGPFMNGEFFTRVGGRDLPDWVAEFDCESWAQYSLKYILAHPAVTCVLTETTKAHHMEDNARAGLGRLPDRATKQRMRDYTAGL
ncbi:MAG: aldo/keto reductase [Proteobacteria bacterium]|nr:aldo/keto reductase [Pseudomonadota bacterium]